MRILVVGGAGYVGSITVDHLVDTGHDVTVLDNLVAGHRDAVHEMADLAHFDLRDENELHHLFAANSFDAVIHYGGYIQAGESVQQPGRYFANNVNGTVSLLNAMVAFGVSRFVFSSSAAVYGEPQELPIPENHPIAPINPYGETKAAVERMLPWYESAFGIRHVSLRYFNACGATLQRGEDHRPETHLIPNVLQVALEQRPSISLFGTDYPTRDGTCIRDYIHVADLAVAHLLALDYTEKGNAAFNLGSGRGFTNREIIEAARAVTGHPIPLVEQPRRAGDPAELVASNAKAVTELGWRLEHTDLEAIIATAWAWHTAHPSGYHD
jgi:UDP-glucose 4-epimerase